jgi:hypothetical protein
MCLRPANSRATLMYPYYVLYLVVYTRTSPLSILIFDSYNNRHYITFLNKNVFRIIKTTCSFVWSLF